MILFFNPCNMITISRRVLIPGSQIKFLIPSSFSSHTKTCPSKNKGAVCSGSGSLGKSPSSTPGGIMLLDFERAEKSGPCRMAFIPEEWFSFFYPITGVSGPYLFGLNFLNYLISKEIYVMEHDYYIGLSVLVILYGLVTKLGPIVGATLDKEVDAFVADWEKGRQDERSGYEKFIEAAKDAKRRAKGQKMLIDAKKENIAMQLEAVYRERMMMVYRTVTGRMDYHVKRNSVINKIHQKWMIAWILDNVKKSITPEFKQQALRSAIRDLAAAASKRRP